MGQVLAVRLGSDGSVGMWRLGPAETWRRVERPSAASRARLWRVIGRLAAGGFVRLVASDGCLVVVPSEGWRYVTSGLVGRQN